MITIPDILLGIVALGIILCGCFIASCLFALDDMNDTEGEAAEQFKTESEKA